MQVAVAKCKMLRNKEIKFLENVMQGVIALNLPLDLGGANKILSLGGCKVSFVLKGIFIVLLLFC